MPRPRPRALIVSLTCQPPGGAACVGAWTLQALHEEYDLGVVTWEPFEPRAIDSYFGTSLASLAIERFCPPWWLRLLVDHAPIRPLISLQLALLMRLCHGLRHRYQKLISAQSEMDLGRPGIQYVHFPSALDDQYWWEKRSAPAWYRGMVGAYRRFCRWLCDADEKRMWLNLTMANSAFTAAACRRMHPHVEPQVLYPAVPMPRLSRPWSERRNEFICIGRVHPSKRVLELIDVIEVLRGRGHDVRLHVVGDDQGSPYGRLVADRARGRPWVLLHGAIDRSVLRQLLSEVRYGLHGMQGEHFGIAVAEMVRAGLVVFVPDDGGPVEIVGGHEALTYGSMDEAVDKIDAVLRAPQQQEYLRHHLETLADNYSSERFAHAMREAVLKLR
jgi:glycosyltransferase involved in cell wall biosynthesis